MPRALAQVGFQWRSFIRDPDRPCPLGMCDSWDAYLWSKQAMVWITAIRKRAKTPEQRALVTRMIKRYKRSVIRAAECIATCRTVVEALVMECRLAQEASKQWGKPVYTDEVPHLWPRDDPRGLTPRPADREWLKTNFSEWPGLMGRIWDTAKEQIADHLDTAKAAVWRYVVPTALGVGLLAFLIGRARR